LFEANCCIGTQTVMQGSPPNCAGIEESTFQKNICCCFRDTAIESAKYSGDAQWLFCITNHQVFGTQGPFFTIECSERSSGLEESNVDLIPLYLRGIEGM